MDELPPNFLKCPGCEGTVLDRTVDRCMYCDATLPPEFLLSKEDARQLDIAQRESRKGNDALRNGDGPDVIGVVADVIDVIVDLGDLFD